MSRKALGKRSQFLRSSALPLAITEASVYVNSQSWNRRPNKTSYVVQRRSRLARFRWNLHGLLERFSLVAEIITAISGVNYRPYREIYLFKVTHTGVHYRDITVAGSNDALHLASLVYELRVVLASCERFVRKRSSTCYRIRWMFQLLFTAKLFLQSNER